MDLETSEELFEPFLRRQELSQANKELGYGGTGMGLTIVRLMSDQIGCHVGFTKPSKGYSTAFFVSWNI